MPFGRAEPPMSAALLADKALVGSSRLKTGASQVALVVKPPPHLPLQETQEKWV